MADAGDIEAVRDFNRFYTAPPGHDARRPAPHGAPARRGARALRARRPRHAARRRGCARRLDDRRRPAEPAAQAPRGRQGWSSACPPPPTPAGNGCGLTHEPARRRSATLDAALRATRSARCSTRFPTRTPRSPPCAACGRDRAHEPDTVHPRPRARRPRLARRAPRRALRPRVRLGRRASSGSSPGSPPTSTRAPTARWIAEVDGERAGAVLCVHDDATTAKLRTLLVEPSARGLGLGVQAGRRGDQARAPRAATDADAVDQRRPARRPPDLRARRLHARSSEAPHHAFGHDLVEQTWSLTLQPWTETH